MKIAVGIKWVADLDSVDVDPLSGRIDESRLLYVLDPAAESALATALVLAKPADVSVYSVGDAHADAALRVALAAGVGSAIRLEGDARPALTASLLARAMQADGPFDLVLVGARSSDHASGEVPGLLAESLGLPLVTDATSLTRDGESWRSERELDRGTRELVSVRGPAVIGLSAGIARLGTASLPNLLKAKGATIVVRAGGAGPLATDPIVLERTELPVRPRVRPVRGPEGTPAERLATVTGGAAGTKTRGRLMEGPPGEMADAIMTFLRERGFLGGS